MKKLVASVVLIAVGAFRLQAASNEGSENGGRFWSVSAALREFYDDNVNGAPSSGDQIKTWGFEVEPAVHANFGNEQTSASFLADFSYKYYDQKPDPNQSEHYSWTLTLGAGLQHAFNERYQLGVNDNFVIGQEPDVLRSGNAFLTFQRIPGNNVVNNGAINFLAQLTPILGFSLGYGNSFFDYADHGEKTVDPTNPNNPPPPLTGPAVQVIPSTAGSLNNIANTITLDSRWTINPELVGIVGFAFSQVNYNAGEYITGISVNGGINDPNPIQPFYQSSIRNARSYYGRVGVEDTMNPDLTASAYVGARYTDQYNDPTADNEVSPYANLNASYRYAQGCSLSGGFTYDYTPTDLIDPNTAGQVVGYGQSAVVYLTLSHQIIPSLVGTLNGQFQDTMYHGGGASGESEYFYTFGANLRYTFIRYLAAEVGYNYDKLDSNIQPGFSRNRFYVGLIGSY